MNSTNCLAFSASAIFLLTLAEATSNAQKPDAEAARIDALIQKLSSEDFETRDSARQALLPLGRKALAPLRKGNGSRVGIAS